MNFHLNNSTSVILMSVRAGAPYQDSIQDEGKVLIYEGHDVPRKKGSNIDPKSVDQKMYTEFGYLTENGKFYNAAMRYKNGKTSPEHVKVYEKIKSGIWAYNGIFLLTDAWTELSGKRKVFKFKLELIDEHKKDNQQKNIKTDFSRIIPTSVKVEVWKRDKGRCAICGSEKDLHFDHIIPYSKGGSSTTAKNVQILCAKCNLNKSDKII
ncbi:HNH endonuclease [bacterium]|nr:HNH endonuclease [bacterium]